MSETWLAVFVAALSGGIVAKLIDYPVDWIKYYFGQRKTAKSLVDAHLKREIQPQSLRQCARKHVLPTHLNPIP